MMDFVKKQRAGFFISILTIILAVVALFIYTANGKNTYYNDFNSNIAILTVITIAVEIILMIAAQIFGEKQYLDIAYIVVSILLAIAAIIFISARVQSAGIILGSDLEKGNKVAVNALNQAFVGIFFYFMALVTSLLGSFFPQKKAD